MLVHSKKYIQRILLQQFSKDKKHFPKSKNQNPTQQPVINYDPNAYSHPSFSALGWLTQIQESIKDKSINAQLNKHLNKNSPVTITAFKLYSKANLKQSLGWVSSINANQKNIKLVHEINLLAIYMLIANQQHQKALEMLGSIKQTIVKDNHHDLAFQILQNIKQVKQPIKRSLMMKLVQLWQIQQLSVHQQQRLFNILRLQLQQALSSSTLTQQFLQFFFSLPLEQLWMKNIANQSSFIYQIISQRYLGKETITAFASFYKMLEIPLEDKAHQKVFFTHFQNLLELFQIRSGEYAFSDYVQLGNLYQKSIQEKDQGLALICVFIALDCNSLIVARDFLLRHYEVFPSLPEQVAQMLTNAYKMKTAIGGLETLKPTQNDHSMMMKKNIIEKNYEQAFAIFEEHILKPLVIEKEKKVLSYVYENAMETFTRENQSQFIGSLSDQQIWDCYNSRQDLTNRLKPMLPDDHFTYWEDTFKLKRAKEIYKLEKTGKLNSIRDSPNATGDSFHLNTYLNFEYPFQRQKAVKSKNDEMELDLFIKKLEYLLMDFPQQKSQKKERALLFHNIQKSLSQVNLEKLHYFGILNYDISQYDVDELKNRFRQLRKYRGVIREPDNYPNPYITLEQEYQEGADLILKKSRKSRKEKKQKKKQKKKASQEDEANEEVNEEANEQANEEGQSQTQQPNQGQAEEVLEAAEQQPVQEGEYQMGQVEEEIPPSQLMELMRLKNQSIFKMGDILMKISPSGEVDKLIQWGVIYKQPMAIYLGQKLAMITGQTIPHHLANRVSSLMSYKIKLSQGWINDCKKCLQVVGRIEREQIYDINYEKLAGSIIQELPEQAKDRLSHLQTIMPRQIDLDTSRVELLKRTMNHEIY